MDMKLVRRLYKYVTKSVGILPDPETYEEIEALARPPEPKKYPTPEEFKRMQEMKEAEITEEDHVPFELEAPAEILMEMGE